MHIQEIFEISEQISEHIHSQIATEITTITPAVNKHGKSKSRKKGHL